MIDIKTLTSIEQIILDEGNTLTDPRFPLSFGSNPVTPVLESQKHLTLHENCGIIRGSVVVECLSAITQ